MSQSVAKKFRREMKKEIERQLGEFKDTIKDFTFIERVRLATRIILKGKI